MSIQILVQAFSTEKTQIVNCEPQDELTTLFRKIADLRHVEQQDLKMVYAGKEYRPDDKSCIHKSLADLGMKNRSIVQLVTRQKGGQFVPQKPYGQLVTQHTE